MSYEDHTGVWRQLSARRGVDENDTLPLSTSPETPTDLMTPSPQLATAPIRVAKTPNRVESSNSLLAGELYLSGESNINKKMQQQQPKSTRFITIVNDKSQEKEQQQDEGEDEGDDEGSFRFLDIEENGQQANEQNESLQSPRSTYSGVPESLSPPLLTSTYEQQPNTMYVEASSSNRSVSSLQHNRTGGSTSSRIRPPLRPRFLSSGSHNNSNANTTSNNNNVAVGGGGIGNALIHHRRDRNITDIPPVQHRRVQSAGDQSFISVLTDPELSGGSVIDDHHNSYNQAYHHNNDGLDQNQIYNDAFPATGETSFNDQLSYEDGDDDTPSILQPILNDVSSPPTGSSNANSSLGNLKNGDKSSNINTFSGVDHSDTKDASMIGDIANLAKDSSGQLQGINMLVSGIIQDYSNPLETEAENAILQAIEDGQQGRSGNEDVGSNSLLKYALCSDSDAVGALLSNVKNRNDKGTTDNGQQEYTKLEVDDKDTVSLRPANQSQLNRTKSEVAATVKANRPTVKDRIFSTAEQLRELQMGANINESTKFQHHRTTDPVFDTSTDTGAESQEIPPPTTADIFVRNAALLRRAGGSKGKVHSLDIDQDIESGNSIQGINSQAEQYQPSHRGHHHCYCCFGTFKDKKYKTDSNNGCGSSETSRSEAKAGLFQKMKDLVFRGSDTVVKNALVVKDFYEPRKQSILSYCKTITLFVFIPTLIVSISLFYANNPSMCTVGEYERKAKDCPSISWLFNFLFIRQVITFSLAMACESFIIDFLLTRRKSLVNILGPRATLWIVGSKGWPFLIFMWAILDLMLLYGGGRFPNHWLYWQNFIPFFNANNPSGTATQHQAYLSAIIVCLVLSFLTTCKRYLLGLSFGQKMYANYGKELATLMQDMLLISLIAKVAHSSEGPLIANIPSESAFFKQVSIGRNELQATLNREFGSEQEKDEAESGVLHPNDERNKKVQRKISTITPDVQGNPDLEGQADCIASNVETKGDTQELTVLKEEPIFPFSDQSRAPEILMSEKEVVFQETTEFSQKIKMNALLGQWEEPKYLQKRAKNVSISEILEFRQALTFMDDVYPFTVYFGPANRRDRCAESAEKVYRELMKYNPDQKLLSFRTLASVAVGKDGNIDQKKYSQLRRMFRQDKDGNLTPLDFVKSCDEAYKKVRLFRASVANSSQIDEAFEGLFNIAFYALMFFVILAIMGVDTIALFVAFSSIIVGFAFMIGSASSKYFEGILFILVRRPYDIGDRIHVSNPQDDTNPNGSSGWFVENVDLFTTTVRFATTNEVATYSNGALASSRIINGARSPNAIVYIYLKFDTNVPDAKIKIFHKSIESFVSSRPREWISFSGFRPTRIETDLGYIEYVITVKHTESWQNVLPILTSKAALASYCLEVSKQLEMKYAAPELPVTLDLKNPIDTRKMIFGVDSESAAHFGTNPGASNSTK